MSALSSKTVDFIETHRLEKIERIALLLSKQKELDATFVLRQIEGWQKLRHKVPTWSEIPDLHYPPRLSLEQCSSEETARYKQEVVERYLTQRGETMNRLSFADLTGGLGVDFSFLAQKFAQATYVEQNEALALLARHNFPLLGLPHACVQHATAEQALQDIPPTDCLLLDPARRDGQGRKTVALADCSPDVAALQARLWDKCRYLLLKLSPMLDVHQALQQLSHVAQVHFVASGSECKEVFLLADAQHEGPPTFCVGQWQFTLDEEQKAQPRYTARPEGFLYEPHAAAMKSGGFKSFATHWDLHKLHPQSHLYCSATLHKEVPARVFRLVEQVGFSKSELKSLASLGKANLTVRNFPETVDVLRKRLRLREGGEVYLFATTLADERRVLLRCEKV